VTVHGSGFVSGSVATLTHNVKRTLIGQ